MKYIGAILIMCGCITLSYFYEKSEKNKIRYLIKMRDFISYAKTKIDLFLTPLNKLYEEYNDDFINKLSENGFQDLNNFFDKNSCEYLEDFFKSLGKGMKNEELSLCDYTVSKLSEAIENAEADYKNKVKVFRTLVIFGGASLIILIV